MIKLNIYNLQNKKPSFIEYGFYTTEYGEIIVFWTKKGICGLHFLVNSPDWHVALAQKKFPGTLFTYHPLMAKQWWERIIAAEVPIPILLYGTTFQQKVWKALCTIPIGKTISYQALSQQLGMGVHSTRAVAGAVAKNFIALLIPCHRVVRKNGDLGGYRWGLQKKAMLLQHSYKYYF